MSRTRSEALQECRFLGGMPFAFSILGLLLAAGRADIAGRLAVALGICYALLFVIRVLCYRARPEAETYRTILGKFSAASFPSLHVARAAVQAVVLGTALRAPWAWGILGTLVGLTGYSRIREGRHTTWDVVSGAGIGSAVAYATALLL